MHANQTCTIKFQVTTHFLMIPVLLYLTWWCTHQRPLEFTILSFVAPKYFIAECSRVEKGSIVDSTTEE